MRTRPPFIRRYQIPLFYVLAFALTWIVWGSEAAEARGLLSFHLPDKLAYFGVTFAAVIVALLAGGKAGFLGLVKRMVRVRAGPQWYAAVLLGPFAISMAAVGIYRLFGGTIVLDPTVTLGVIPIFLLNEVALFWGTEELGWRGFALPRLQSRYNALTAALIAGVLWGLWHTPAFLNPASPISTYPYVAFLVFAVGESIIVTWVYNHTRGSVVIAALLHGATDVALVFNGTILNGAPLFWLVTGVTWAVALVIIAVEGPATLARGARIHPEAVVEIEPPATRVATA